MTATMKSAGRSLGIGITIGLHSADESLWNNGIKQNALFLAKLLAGSPLGHQAAITNVSLSAFPGGCAWAGRIDDVSAMLPDLDRTAALIETLDLLITVDTGVAHLAGALGVPVWILLHSHGDARWGQPGDEQSY